MLKLKFDGEPTEKQAGSTSVTPPYSTTIVREVTIEWIRGRLHDADEAFAPVELLRGCRERGRKREHQSTQRYSDAPCEPPMAGDERGATYRDLLVRLEAFAPGFLVQRRATACTLMTEAVDITRPRVLPPHVRTSA